MYFCNLLVIVQYYVQHVVMCSLPSPHQWCDAAIS